MIDFPFGSWGCQLSRHVARVVYFVTILFVYKLDKSLYENGRRKVLTYSTAENWCFDLESSKCIPYIVGAIKRLSFNS